MCLFEPLCHGGISKTYWTHLHPFGLRASYYLSSTAVGEEICQSVFFAEKRRKGFHFSREHFFYLLPSYLTCSPRFPELFSTYVYLAFRSNLALFLSCVARLDNYKDPKISVLYFFCGTSQCLALQWWP